jgi:hypothetical protein
MTVERLSGGTSNSRNVKINVALGLIQSLTK